MQSKSSGRSITAGMAGLTVASAAAVAVALAPGANATVDVITVSDSAPTVGGTYTLSADLSGASIGLLVNWNDNGASLTDGVGIIPWPVGHSSVTWKPTTPGQHIITASQGSSTQTLIVNVAGGTTTPPTTTPPTTTTAPTTTAPTTTKPSTGGGGSIGSGSATGSAGKLVGGLLSGLFGSS
ncbi:hypothetical protein ACFV4K_35445 [Nocardia sp. NPDC059764]|uniref:hypothetical protein n=1 Tax=Nocardia sp. NPDC059764 TaxID=3346939 RepID=UPI00364C2890